MQFNYLMHHGPLVRMTRFLSFVAANMLRKRSDEPLVADFDFGGEKSIAI